MHDVLPEQTARWQFVEQHVRDVLGAYGYKEIRLPIVEKTELFKRSIGEVTDIVEKEMYSFDDRNGDSLTLRPEGTAGCVRPVWNMAYCIIRYTGSGITDRCFAMSVRRKDVIGSLFN